MVDVVQHCRVLTGCSAAPAGSVSTTLVVVTQYGVKFEDNCNQAARTSRHKHAHSHGRARKHTCMKMHTRKHTNSHWHTQLFDLHAPHDSGPTPTRRPTRTPTRTPTSPVPSATPRPTAPCVTATPGRFVELHPFVRANLMPAVRRWPNSRRTVPKNAQKVRASAIHAYTARACMHGRGSKLTVWSRLEQRHSQCHSV